MNLKVISLYIAGLLGFSAVGAVGDQNTPAALVTQSLTVEVLIYSGRPNPAFTITDPGEIREISALIEGLPKAGTAGASSSKSAPKLGYQGIAVRSHYQALPSLESFSVRHTQIDVFRSATSVRAASVAIEPASKAAELIDAPKRLETRLLELAKAKGALTEALAKHIAENE